MRILLWILRIVPAVILLQTVVIYKFPGHPDSIELFTKLSNFLNGMVSEGLLRFGTGILEVIASILILVPRTSKFGALMIVGLMAGAILSHIFVLGYDKVFILALITFACSVGYLALARRN